MSGRESGVATLCHTLPYYIVRTMEEPVENLSSGRREQRKIERRRAILSVAARCFKEGGYGSTTMSNISAALGGSKGTLWSYFQSKEQLFSAVLDEATASYKEQLSGLLDHQADLRTALTDFCRNFLETITSREAITLQQLVQGESGRFPELGVIFFDRAPKVVQDKLSAFLARHMEKRHLRADDHAMAARAIISLCMGGSHQQMLLGGPAPSSATLKAEAALTVDIFLRAYSLSHKVDRTG